MRLHQKMKQIKNAMIRETPNINVSYVLSTAKMEVDRIEQAPFHSYKKPFSMMRLASGLSFVLILTIAVVFGLRSFDQEAPSNEDFFTTEDVALGFGFSSLVSYYLGHERLFLEDSGTDTVEGLMVSSNIDFLAHHVPIIKLIQSHIDAPMILALNSEDVLYTDRLQYEQVISYQNNYVYDIYYNKSQQGQNIVFEGVVYFNDQIYAIEGIQTGLEVNSPFTFILFMDPTNPSDFVQLYRARTNELDVFRFTTVKNNQIIEKSEITLFPSLGVSLQLADVLLETPRTIFNIGLSSVYENDLEMSYFITDMIDYRNMESAIDSDALDYTIYEEGEIVVSIIEGETQPGSFGIQSGGSFYFIPASNP